MSTAERQECISNLLYISASFGDQYAAVLSHKPYSLDIIIDLFQRAEELSGQEGINRTWEGLEFIRSLAIKTAIAASKSANGDEQTQLLIEKVGKYDDLLKRYHRRNKHTEGRTQANSTEALPVRERLVEISFGDVYVKELDGTRKVITGVPNAADAGTFLSGKITKDNRGREMIELPVLEDTSGMIIVDRWDVIRVLGAFERGWRHYCPDEPFESFAKMFEIVLTESVKPSQKLPLVVK